MNSIGVFCGSGVGRRPEYKEGAIALGKAVAQRDMTLVYGGASVGLMGELARSALEHEGKVVGIMPTHIADMEVAMTEGIELVLVQNMQERKQKIEALCDAFVALPGGFGTLDEIFEMTVALQLNLHHKPCGLLNIAGYWDDLLRMIDNMECEQFILPEHRDMLIASDSVEALFQGLAQFSPPAIDKGEWAKGNLSS